MSVVTTSMHGVRNRSPTSGLSVHVHKFDGALDVALVLGRVRDARGGTQSAEGAAKMPVRSPRDT